MRGLSQRNLIYMRTLASEYPDPIAQHPAAQLPWGHILVLLDRLPDPRIRDWYASQAANHGWSRATLIHHITSDRHLRVGAAPNNFPTTLPAHESDLAHEILQDPVQPRLPRPRRRLQRTRTRTRTRTRRCPHRSAHPLPRASSAVAFHSSDASTSSPSESSSPPTVTTSSSNTRFAVWTRRSPSAPTPRTGPSLRMSDPRFRQGPTSPTPSGKFDTPKPETPPGPSTGS